MSREIATSIAKNTTIMMISQIITWASSFVLMMFLPRYLGSEDYGRLFLAVSLTMMFQPLVDFGARSYVAKEVARSPEQTPELIANTSGIHGLLWVVSLLAMLLLSILANYTSKTVILILILGVASLWERIEKLLGSCFQGYEMIQYPTFGAIAERVFLTAAGVTALLLGADSLAIAGVMAFSTLLNFVIVVKYTPRIVSQLPRFDWRRARGIMKDCFPYFLYSIFAVIYFRIDAVMLSWMTPEAVVGWYGAAYRLFDVLMFLPSIFSTAVLPVLSRLWAKEQQAMVRTMQKGLEFILVAGIPISIATFALSEEIVRFFFGLNEYGPSVLLLRIFSTGLILVYVDFILGSVLVASDRHRQWMFVAFIAVFLNPILNYFLIPYTQLRFGNGGIGAAIATIGTEFFVMTAALTLMPKGILDASNVKVPLKAIRAGVLMASLIWLMGEAGVPWMIQVSTSLGVYTAALISARVLEPSDLSFLRDYFSFRNLKETLMMRRDLTV